MFYKRYAYTGVIGRTTDTWRMSLACRGVTGRDAICFPSSVIDSSPSEIAPRALRHFIALWRPVLLGCVGYGKFMTCNENLNILDWAKLTGPCMLKVLINLSLNLFCHSRKSDIAYTYTTDLPSMPYTLKHLYQNPLCRTREGTIAIIILPHNCDAEYSSLYVGVSLRLIRDTRECVSIPKYNVCQWCSRSSTKELGLRYLCQQRAISMQTR